MKNRLLKRRIGGKPARDGGQKECVVPFGHPCSHNHAFAACELIESAGCSLRGGFLVECSLIRSPFRLRSEYDNQNPTRQPKLLPEPIKVADFRYGDGHVIGCFVPADPLVDIGIRQRQEVFEKCQPRLVHAWDMLFCIMAQIRSSFFVPR